MAVPTSRYSYPRYRKDSELLFVGCFQHHSCLCSPRYHTSRTRTTRVRRTGCRPSFRRRNTSSRYRVRIQPLRQSLRFGLVVEYRREAVERPPVEIEVLFDPQFRDSSFLSSRIPSRSPTTIVPIHLSAHSETMCFERVYKKYVRRSVRFRSNQNLSFDRLSSHFAFFFPK